MALEGAILEALEPFISNEMTLFQERCLGAVKKVSLKNLLARKTPISFALKIF
jgi:hypothetical protein